MSIRWKLIGGALSFLLLFAAVYIATSLVTARQKADGLVINIAGRQRVLAEKMSKELLAYADTPTDEHWKLFDDTRTLFSQSLNALRDGGPVPMSHRRNFQVAQTAELPAAANHAIRTALVDVGASSERFNAAAAVIRADARTAQNAADEILKQVPLVIAKLESVVKRSQVVADGDDLDEEQRKEWTQIINLTARQMLLAHRMGTLALEDLRRPTEKLKAQLESEIALFDATLAALASGGAVVLDLDDPETVTMIAAAPDARVQKRLAEAQNRWADMKLALRRLEISAVTKASAVELVHTLSTKLHEGMDDVVELNQTLSEHKVAMIDTVQLVALVLGVLFVVIAAVLGNRLGTNVIEAVGVAQTIAAGDLTQRQDVTESDETGRLLDSLNQMADQLSELVHKVQVSGVSVGTCSTQIASSAKRQETAISDLAASATQIAATSTQIAATADELLETMNKVGSVSESTSRRAANSKRGLEAMQSTMAKMVSSTETVTDRLATISQKTAKISTVVGTIMKIAQQTNLISLNAAIEAENAGELGLGFAVVAKEVRRLADQTAKASTGIEQMVGEMQSAVSTAVMGMDGFSEDIRSGSEEVRQVVSRLGRIIGQVEDIGPRFDEVREGMSAQAVGAGQIADGVRQIVESSGQTAESVRQTNASITELMHAAGELKEGVERFKVVGSGV